MREDNISGWRSDEQGRETPTGRIRSPRSTNSPRETLIIPVAGKSTAAPRRSTAGMRKATAAPATGPQVTLPTRIIPVAVGADAETSHEAYEPAPGETLVLPETRIARRATTARPIRAEDTALVERATLVLQIVDAVPVDPRALASSSPDDRAPVTIIPRTEELPAIRAAASVVPKRRPRGLRSSALLWGLACVIVLGVISATTPLAGHFFPRPFVPVAARIAIDPSAVPNGPWASSSGAVQTLGIGGGAGPGVKAPGTAGLPVKNPPNHASNSPSKPPSSGISPAPVSPWPPSNPYMYVPGHPAFSVQPNGYYSWAFGQCTWWAQWERRDENLTHMGNAMYWASSAAARGYHVGSVPVAGATVVLQPGVQGAGGAGHVAHVVAVYPDGWFLVSEMNFYWNGGGWGRVDYRFVHAGWGVQFIY